MEKGGVGQQKAEAKQRRFILYFLSGSNVQTAPRKWALSTVHSVYFGRQRGYSLCTSSLAHTVLIPRGASLEVFQ